MRNLSILSAISVALFLVFASSAFAQSPSIYRWTDSDGVAHFTTDLKRVPRHLRHRVDDLAAAPSEPNAGTDAPTDANSVGMEATSTDWIQAEGSTLEQPTGTQSIPSVGPMATRETGTARPSNLGRIAELERAIAEDEEAIKNWLTQSDGDGGTPEEFKAVARRLPKLQSELATLRQSDPSAP